MWLWVLGCAEPPVSAPPGSSTGTPILTPETFDPECAPDDLTYPSIDAVEVTCADGAMFVAIETFGWTGTGGLLLADGPLRGELQRVETQMYDPCGEWERLTLTIRSTGADDAFPGLSTTFDCPAIAADPAVLTFAAWVTSFDPAETTSDQTDAPAADCLAWGVDPEGVAGGAFDGALPEMLVPTDGFAGCRTVPPEG